MASWVPVDSTEIIGSSTGQQLSEPCTRDLQGRPSLLQTLPPLPGVSDARRPLSGSCILCVSDLLDPDWGYLPQCVLKFQELDPNMLDFHAEPSSVCPTERGSVPGAGGWLLWTPALALVVCHVTTTVGKLSHLFKSLGPCP